MTEKKELLEKEGKAKELNAKELDNTNGGADSEINKKDPVPPIPTSYDSYCKFDPSRFADHDTPYMPGVGSNMCRDCIYNMHRGWLNTTCDHPNEHERD